MKAISLWQPWASLVVLGEKKIETRSWDTAYRGPLLIHAAQRKHLAEWRELMGMLEFHDAFAKHDIEGLAGLIVKMPLGCLIGSVDLVRTSNTESIRGKLSHREWTFGNYSDRRYGWHLENPVLFEHPVAYKGSQGFFDVPCEIIGNTLNLLEVQR